LAQAAHPTGAGSGRSLCRASVFVEFSLSAIPIFLPRLIQRFRLGYLLKPSKCRKDSDTNEKTPAVLKKRLFTYSKSAGGISPVDVMNLTSMHVGGTRDLFSLCPNALAHLGVGMALLGSTVAIPHFKKSPFELLFDQLQSETWRKIHNFSLVCAVNFVQNAI
jgi:hypothetical protein